MKIGCTATRLSIGAVLLLTALLCWGCRNNEAQVYKSIQEAAVNGDLKDVERHLKQGEDVNAKDEDGKGPLHKAAFWGHKDVVELLLAKGADVNAKDNNRQTPLFSAAQGDHVDVAELLIAKGADVNAKDEKGQTPLHIAALLGFKAVAELLIAKKADVNAMEYADPYYTPLSNARIGGHQDMIDLLKKHGAQE